MTYKSKEEVELDVYYLIYETLKGLNTRGDYNNDYGSDYKIYTDIGDKGVKGSLYLSDTRNDRSAEDCVIRCTALVNQSCYQEGVVNINVYVPFINRGQSVMTKDTKRVIEISNILKRVNDYLVRDKMSLKRKGYYFREEEGIYSYQDDGETLVNNKLSFTYYGY